MNRSRFKHSRTSIASNSKRLALKPNRAYQSQVVYQSNLNVVETYGATLPVLVREALTFSEKSSAASAQISNEGWAWLVCGRRLLIWQCDVLGEDGRRRPVSGQCRELTLPSSDLAYRAQLVVLFTNSNNQVPSCMAASPEGIVRYWPSISDEGSSVEVNANLHGQECESLTDLFPLGCILATTTASIVLLTTLSSGGRPSIAVRPFKPPQGWLGGITHLIPSLIFGSLQSGHGMETKLVKVAATKERGAWMLYMLAGHTFQQWLLAPRELERLVSEWDVRKLAVEAFQKTIWETSGGNAADILVWFLDLQPTDDGVCILLGATNPQVSLQFFYALATLTPNPSQQPTRFDRFCPIRANSVYRESDENELLSCRVLFYGGSALLYTRRNLLAVSATNFGEDADSLDVISPNNEILGASLCRGIPVLFTREHGLISVTPIGSVRSEINDSVSDMVTADSSIASLNQEPVASIITISDAELEEMESSADPTVILEAAFIHFLRSSKERSEHLVRSVLPQEGIEIGNLDSTVIRASLDLVDATPSGDPRWAANVAGVSFGSSSMQITHQLQDKLRTADAFVAFLKWSKIWDKVHSVIENEVLCETKLILAEHREKIVAALNIRELQNNNANLIETCIQRVIASNVPAELTAQDVFYRQVSQVHLLLQALVTWSDNLAHTDRRPQDVGSGILSANNILLKATEAVLEWRHQHIASYIPSGSSVEYLPWTASGNSGGLRQALMLQHSLTLKYGARVTGEVTLRNKLYDQLLKLTDIILDGWRAHVASVRNLPKYDALNQQYDTTRFSLIKPFLDDGLYERAAVLGEKYLDFNTLVQVCEKTDNLDRLDSYCDKYNEQNFSEFLFNWYIKEGKPGRLLERLRQRAKPSQQQLSRFLTDHPSLSWLQDIFCHDFIRASGTLLSMASSEKDLLHRKKTMISLSKLCELAANEPKEVEEEKFNELDAELELVALQEDLPSSVLAAHGHDISLNKVLSPSEIIKMYISPQNLEASENDFKKALDLLPYIPDNLERNTLRDNIFCNAILRDSWTDIDTDAPTNPILDLFFFKLVELLDCMGCVLEEILPPVGCILDSESLGDLRNDRQFQYLIRLGYEHFQKS